MKIETKYNRGDSVWAIFGSEIIEFEIDDIYAFTRNGVLNIDYVSNDVYTRESRVFKTKQELIDSL